MVLRRPLLGAGVNARPHSLSHGQFWSEIGLAEREHATDLPFLTGAARENKQMLHYPTRLDLASAVGAVVIEGGILKRIGDVVFELRRGLDRLRVAEALHVAKHVLADRLEPDAR